MTKMFYGRVWVFLVPSNKYVNTTGVDLHAVYWVAYNHGFFLVCIWLLFCFETLQAPTCICHPGHWRAVSVPSKWCPWLEIRFPSNLCKLIRNHPHGKQGNGRAVTVPRKWCPWLEICAQSNVCRIIRTHPHWMQAPTFLRHPGIGSPVFVPNLWCLWLEISAESKVRRLFNNHLHWAQVWIQETRHLEMELNNHATIFANIRTYDMIYVCRYCANPRFPCRFWICYRASQGP